MRDYVQRIAEALVGEMSMVDGLTTPERGQSINRYARSL
jgi:hypothetical protein